MNGSFSFFGTYIELSLSAFEATGVYIFFWAATFPEKMGEECFSAGTYLMLGNDDSLFFYFH